jgi:hypothetical protein
MHTVTADNKQRVRLPDIKPGDVLAYENNGDGSVTLRPVKADVKERPYDPHLYDDYPQERIDLEAASAKVNVGSEERDRK